MFNQGVNNSQRAGNNCNYEGEGSRNWHSIFRLEILENLPEVPGLGCLTADWSRKQAHYADVIVPLSPATESSGSYRGCKRYHSSQSTGGKLSGEYITVIHSSPIKCQNSN